MRDESNACRTIHPSSLIPHPFPFSYDVFSMADTQTDESTLLLERSAAIAEALMNKDWPSLRAALCDLHPSDIADMVIALPPKHEGILFRVLPRQLATRVFA